MKNSMINLFRFALFLPFVSACLADGWIGTGKITTVHLRPDSNDFLVVHDIMIDKDCGQKPSYYKWDMTKEFSDHVLSMALTAYVSGKPVNMHVKCDGAGHPTITQIVLQPNT